LVDLAGTALATEAAMRCAALASIFFWSAPVLAQAPAELDSVLEAAREAMDRDPGRARILFKKATGLPGADGRGYLGIAELELRAGAAVDASISAQRAYLRAEESWMPPAVRTRAEAADVLGRARIALGDADGALAAYLHGLSLEPLPTTRRRAARVARALGRSTPSRVATEYLSRAPLRAVEAPPCMEQVEEGGWEAEDESVQCVLLEEWRVGETLWQAHGIGDETRGQVALSAHSEGRWFALGPIATRWSDWGSTTSHAIEWREPWRFGGDHWLVADVSTSGAHAFDERCEQNRTDTHRTLMCHNPQGLPECLWIDRGTFHVHGPDPRICAAEGAIDAVDRPAPEPSRVELGARGVRLVGPAAPPSLARWWSPASLADRWAPSTPYLHGNGGRIDGRLADPVPHELRAVEYRTRAAEREPVRDDIAEFLKDDDDHDPPE
jgi:hypothetical protein